jgi:SAM-dependent methyltransferase
MPGRGNPKKKATRAELERPEFWDEIYLSEDPPGWDRGEAAPPLVSLHRRGALPRRGRLAVLGCGFGHDALYFARRGYEVVGFDFSFEAVEGARRRAREAGAEIRYERRNLFDLLLRHRGRFDLALEHTCFCAVHPGRRTDYVRVAHGLLRPGGVFFGIFYCHGESGGPPFTTTKEEVRRLFAPSFRIVRLAKARDSFTGRKGKEWVAVFVMR